MAIADDPRLHKYELLFACVFDERPLRWASSPVLLVLPCWSGWSRCWRADATPPVFLCRAPLTFISSSRLPRGEFLAMVASELPFGDRTARRLMAIARDPRISNRTHASLLPPSWMTLFELTKLDDAQFQARLAGRHVIAPSSCGSGPPGNGSRNCHLWNHSFRSLMFSPLRFCGSIQ